MNFVKESCGRYVIFSDLVTKSFFPFKSAG